MRVRRPCSLLEIKCTGHGQLCSAVAGGLTLFLSVLQDSWRLWPALMNEYGINTSSLTFGNHEWIPPNETSVTACNTTQLPEVGLLFWGSPATRASHGRVRSADPELTSSSASFWAKLPFRLAFCNLSSMRTTSSPIPPSWGGMAWCLNEEDPFRGSWP